MIVTMIAAALLAQADTSAVKAGDVYQQAGDLIALDDGRLINLRCTGEGGPVVVLEAGATGYSPAWSEVQESIAAKAGTKVCSYDRAGLGFSDAAPGNRGIDGTVADLDALLAKAKIATPVVLVGHSLGGLMARHYTARHPAKVAGLVLLDPSVEGFDARLEEVVPGSTAQWQQVTAGLGRCITAAAENKLPATCTPDLMLQGPEAAKSFLREQLVRPSHYRTAANEVIGATVAEEVVAKDERSLGDRPVVVLTAGGNDLAGPKTTAEQRATAKAMWARMHADVAARSTRGTARVVTTSGHDIQRDAPAETIAAIVEVVETVRSSPEG